VFIIRYLILTNFFSSFTESLYLAEHFHQGKVSSIWYISFSGLVFLRLKFYMKQMSAFPSIFQKIEVPATLKHSRLFHAPSEFCIFLLSAKFSWIFPLFDGPCLLSHLEITTSKNQTTFFCAPLYLLHNYSLLPCVFIVIPTGC
jgi:hypothetical protein